MTYNVNLPVAYRVIVAHAFLLLFCSKAKRKKQVTPEKTVKKQKTGESSKGAASSKQSSNRDENMFQVKLVTHRTWLR